jgi:hypothetical protein
MPNASGPAQLSQLSLIGASGNFGVRLLEYQIHPDDLSIETCRDELVLEESDPEIQSGHRMKRGLLNRVFPPVGTFYEWGIAGETEGGQV